MNLQPYAAYDTKTIGRLHKEDASPLRNEFQRDRDRIIHSTSFRRLQYKTQVFVNHEGDMFRSRLTHSIEVAQISRGIARTLGCHEDLAEAIALAHDLGHTPFGHAGQDALNSCMKGYGGFEHNLQSLRVVDYLESRYADFDGLNLTYETREGILKHCSKKNAIHLGELGKRFINNTSPSLEAQIVNLADEIAYCHHDLDDGFRSQIIDFEQLQDLALFSATAQAVKKKYKHIEPEKLMHESIRRMMYGIINDVCQTSLKKIEEIKPNSINAVRAHQIIITFSPSILDAMMKLKNFSRQYIYRHPKIEQMTLTAKQTIERLFNYFINDIERLPPNFRKNKNDKAERIIADYIAGMTDRYALELAIKIK